MQSLAFAVFWNSALALETSPWHCADLEASQELSTKRSCAQRVGKCPSQPKLHRQTNRSTTPRSLLTLFSLINNDMNSQYHFRRFPSTLLSTLHPGEFLPKGEKSCSGLKVKSPNKYKRFTFIAAVIPSQCHTAPGWREAGCSWPCWVLGDVIQAEPNPLEKENKRVSSGCAACCFCKESWCYSEWKWAEIQKFFLVLSLWSFGEIPKLFTILVHGKQLKGPFFLLKKYHEKVFSGWGQQCRDYCASAFSVSFRSVTTIGLLFFAELPLLWGISRGQVCDPDQPACDVTLFRQASGVCTAKYFCLPSSVLRVQRSQEANDLSLYLFFRFIWDKLWHS